MKKIIIFGFSHCGTTILQSIISRIPHVYNIVTETIVITDKHIQKATEGSYKYILCKFPQACHILNNSEYDEYIKIFIIRNPLWVYSSILKRRKNILGKFYKFERFNNAIKHFAKPEHDMPPNTFCIKYENLFDDLDNLLKKIGFEYTCEIFNTENQYYKSHECIDEIPKVEPSPVEHKLYRCFQVNQKFECMNSIEKLYLTEPLYNEIINNQYVKQIYPDIDTIKPISFISSIETPKSIPQKASKKSILKKTSINLIKIYR
uniref:Sulfotransferase family protein n=1 Tax=Megaviridae environmental sample TaxID=1737588 RepID=A0A5J6VK13_9VIRU|nr:MAG: hypothetical protein [Megaviridae environmental sample]